MALSDARPPDLTAVRIAPAVPADVPVVLALIRELADYERMSDQVAATEADLARALFAAPPRAEAVVARLGDVPVGFALYFHSFSTFAGRAGLYLEDLFVRPSYRGRGVGRRLLAHLARVAVARGCARFEWSVLDWNELAIATYRKAGAVPMDEWTVYRLTGAPLRALAAEAPGEDG